MQHSYTNERPKSKTRAKALHTTSDPGPARIASPSPTLTPVLLRAGRQPAREGGRRGVKMMRACSYPSLLPPSRSRLQSKAAIASRNPATSRDETARADRRQRNTHGDEAADATSAWRRCPHSPPRPRGGEYFSPHNDII